MLRLRNTALVALVLLAAALVAPAGSAMAASGPGGSRADLSSPFLTVSGGVIVGRPVTVSGRVAGAGAGTRVDVQARGRDGVWRRAGTGITDRSGVFTATWRARHLGRYRLRAFPRGAAQLAGTEASPATSTIVHKVSRATWFGPADNGSRTACGVKLTRTVLGVAHKTLPCGTQVSFLYKGRQITVPVIDRGPYTSGVDWDLTQGTAAALGFTDAGLDDIGAVALREDPLAVLTRRP